MLGCHCFEATENALNVAIISACIKQRPIEGTCNNTQHEIVQRP